ncbi:MULTISPECIES: helix-turn-helix domain-containing protein [unclassified Sphingobacterium]|uniref:winged helix-turn-helix transcriptional regulator n=1 Tax=unclassified Sphingobacterium TaxID=2609468 RepID=UPI0010D4C3EE|nr:MULTISPECIES: helix-turn-helix domain-containing protein [unclassified Sphingobacterium]MCS3556284.1 DNA-binding HxlR family transcriptional regulator [Sphingobacterium sp. JUb21]TCR08653.1 HxlR family transcriptional regulator [Sphingobacterium sp. JUb20]
MNININISDENCPLKKTLEIIGGKWTMLIIFQINERTIRYGELKRCIVGISEKMLISQLKFLCDKDIVHKKSFAEIPPKVEYTLTEKGKELLPIIQTIIQYGLKHDL